MIHDSLKQWRRLPGFAPHPVWATAFEWLEREAAQAPPGDHPLDGEGFLARVMAYPLKRREEARYESHRRTVDIQYTIEGGEGIEVCSPEVLTALGDYSEEKDVEHFMLPPPGNSWLHNRAGWFTVLLPGEPHLPQLAAAGHLQVRKVVIKIPVARLG